MKPALFLGSLSLLAVVGCGTAPPRIGEGLNGPVREIPAAFDQRMKTRFPVGSDETPLHSELAREKFTITRDKDSPFSFSASYQSGGIACVYQWTIRWSVYEGRIADIGGYWGQTCL